MLTWRLCRYARQSIVVHEGDAPHALALAAAKYYDFVPQEGSAAEIAKRILAKFESVFPVPTSSAAGVAAEVAAEDQKEL